MLRIEKGILTQDGKKLFAIGQSYYPSFHPGKFPVPPDGDRIGEMRKDLRRMSEMGFNHVRFAAIGTIRLGDGGELVIDTPFVDAMIEEAEKNGMSVSVRLQGYSVNLRDFKDVLMIDNEGNPQNTAVWYDFIQNTLHHAGLNEDNILYAEKLSDHFSKFKNVVAYQIYNEPHYPRSRFFDYHPLAVKAYREWIVKRGEMSEREAKDYEPPRTRREQGAHMWALWRLFSMQSLTNYLGMAAKATAGSGLPSYTCYTMCQAGSANSFRGVDFFGGAENMDIVGFTSYVPAWGSCYYAACQIYDMNFSAAKLCGKESWCVELDSRTTIPPDVFNKNTYSLIGAGIKGLLYYQWRGDAPSPQTPIPNSCGLVNYDGTKTQNYDNAAGMVRLINRLSNYIVNAEPVSYKIGILHSDYAAFYCDAVENQDEERLFDRNKNNSYMRNMSVIYTDIRKAGFAAAFIRPEHLLENKAEIKYLFVPKYDALSNEEKSLVEEFNSSGASVYKYEPIVDDFSFGSSYMPIDYEKGTPYTPYPQFTDIALSHNLVPLVRCFDDSIQIQVLVGHGYALIVAVNTSCIQKQINTELICNFPFDAPVFYSNNVTEGRPLKFENGKILADGITDGGIIIVKTK